VDLTGAFADMAPETLTDAFRTSRTQDGDDASEQLKLARTYLDTGMPEEAIDALQSASRSPRHRFEAASALARLYAHRGDFGKAVEWFERAAEAPAPTTDAGRALLYDLGVALEASGEVARALSVFLELQADADRYRDVQARIGRLTRVQTGG
jgi:lipopolysaccharide biosynthesis regulator YciM